MKLLTTLLFLCFTSMAFAQQKVKVPFIGVRYFELDKGASGSGTPVYYLEIKKNGDVFFGYEQENKADRSINKEKISVGKYKTTPYKVHFKRFNETFYAKFDHKNIYKTDAKGNIIKSDDCCEIREIEDSNCYCQKELLK